MRRTIAVAALLAMIIGFGCEEKKETKAEKAAAGPQAAEKPKPQPAPAASDGKVLDYCYFLEKLIDLDCLPRLEEGVTCKQASSYDRASHDPAKWEANGDCGQYISVDEKTGEALMADLKGPGCIFRIWSANPLGKIRFYLDGDAKPTYEFDFNEMFLDKIYPFKTPIVYKRDPASARSASDCYLPIPYAKSCRVTADKKHSQYYHIGYKTYPAGTKIQSFRLPLNDKEKQTLQKVLDAWNKCGEDPNPKPNAQTITKTVTLAPGQRVVLADLKGPAIIQSIKARLNSPERYALRKWAIQAFWDGETNPSIDSPLGDFFGTGWQENPYSSFPLGMTEKGYYSYWRMPFRQSGRIEVVNEGVKPGELWVEIKYTPAELPPNTASFFAKFRREFPSRVFDVPFIETKGKGQFVGMNLSIDNPGGGWWGEGDEKAWVDGEEFPSTYGTGSEDYFGDAWGIRQLVQPYFACSYAAGPRTCCYRWHISDSIPFATSFKMTIENYDPLTDDDDYCTVAYWYAMKGQQDFFRHCAAPERRPWGKAINYAVQAEEIFKGKGDVIDDVELPYELSSGQAINLGMKKPGDKLDIPGLKASGDCIYTIGVATVQDPSLARFDVYLGGSKVGSAPATYDGKQVIYDIGRAKLAKGDAPASITFTSPGKAVFDCFYLRPAQTDHGRIEAENCQVKSSGPKTEKECVTLDWSNGYQLVLPATKSGDTIELGSGVGWPYQDGEFALIADVTCGPDYGDFQMVANNQPAGPVVRGYSPELQIAKGVVLGNVAVAKRRLDIALKVVGKDEKSKGCKIGLDYFRLGKAIVKGAIEGEAATLVDAKGAKPTVQRLGDRWSLGAQLFFTPKEVGSYVVLEADVKEDGGYALDVYFTKSHDYAIVQVSVDGKPLGSPIDTYCPSVEHMGKVPIGAIDLKAGKHPIKFQSVGKNEMSKGFYMGIDCFTLTKIK